MGGGNLGDFEQIVLLAALRLDGSAYTVAIIEEIRSHTSREPTHAAVYVALRRLEKKGLVTSEMGPPTAERGGRPKRYFRVTPMAVPILRRSRDELLSLWAGLEVPGS